MFSIRSVNLLKCFRNNWPNRMNIDFLEPSSSVSNTDTSSSLPREVFTFEPSSTASPTLHAITSTHSHSAQGVVDMHTSTHPLSLQHGPFNTASPLESETSHHLHPAQEVVPVSSNSLSIHQSPFNTALCQAS